VFWILVLAGNALAACLPFQEAPRHIGETACVHGKVLNVSATSGGTHLLQFCEEGRECGFSAVVFARDLRQVGDVRVLAGREVDIHGQIRLYKGHPEVIVRDPRQLKGEAAKLPAVPKAYDVTKRGKFSPGERPTHNDKEPKAKYPRGGVQPVTDAASVPD